MTSRDQLKKLLTDALVLLCRSVSYEKELLIQATIAVTVDSQDVIVCALDEHIRDQKSFNPSSKRPRSQETACHAADEKVDIGKRSRHSEPSKRPQNTNTKHENKKSEDDVVFVSQYQMSLLNKDIDELSENKAAIKSVKTDSRICSLTSTGTVNPHKPLGIPTNTQNLPSFSRSSIRIPFGQPQFYSAASQQIAPPGVNIINQTRSFSRSSIRFPCGRPQFYSATSQQIAPPVSDPTVTDSSLLEGAPPDSNLTAKDDNKFLSNEMLVEKQPVQVMSAAQRKSHRNQSNEPAVVATSDHNLAINKTNEPSANTTQVEEQHAENVVSKQRKARSRQSKKPIIKVIKACDENNNQVSYDSGPISKANNLKVDADQFPGQNQNFIGISELRRQEYALVDNAESQNSTRTPPVNNTTSIINFQRSVRKRKTKQILNMVDESVHHGDTEMNQVGDASVSKSKPGRSRNRSKQNPNDADRNQYEHDVSGRSPTLDVMTIIRDLDDLCSLPGKVNRPVTVKRLCQDPSNGTEFTITSEESMGNSREFKVTQPERSSQPENQYSIKSRGNTCVVQAEIHLLPEHTALSSGGLPDSPPPLLPISSFMPDHLPVPGCCSDPEHLQPVLGCHSDPGHLLPKYPAKEVKVTVRRLSNEDLVKYSSPQNQTLRDLNKDELTTPKSRPQPKLSCSVCGAICHGKGALTRHIARQHAGTMAYQCQICSRQYAFERSLVLHMAKHANSQGQSTDEKSLGDEQASAMGASSEQNSRDTDISLIIEKSDNYSYQHEVSLIDSTVEKSMRLKGMKGGMFNIIKGGMPLYSCPNCKEKIKWYSLYVQHIKNCTRKSPEQEDNRRAVKGDTEKEPDQGEWRQYEEQREITVFEQSTCSDNDARDAIPDISQHTITEIDNRMSGEPQATNESANAAGLDIDMSLDREGHDVDETETTHAEVELEVFPD